MVGVTVLVTLGVGVRVAVTLLVNVIVGVLVDVNVGVGVIVLVGVCVGVTDFVGVTVCVDVIVFVGGYCVQLDLTLRGLRLYPCLLVCLLVVYRCLYSVSS